MVRAGGLPGRGEVGRPEELLKYLAADRAACARETAQTAPLVRSLGELTLAFSRRYGEKKRAGNFLDYSDLEHQAIRLFLGEDGTAHRRRPGGGRPV